MHKSKHGRVNNIKQLRDLMFLVIEMQSRSYGMTKKQILDALKKKGIHKTQRTLERWLVILEGLGLEYKITDVATHHGNTNSYSVTGIPNAMLKLKPMERNALERYSQIVSDELTKNAINKVLSVQTNLSTAIINDLQELIEQTPNTTLVQPRINVETNKMEIIERSILDLTEIKFKYKIQKTQKSNQKQEKPIGLLYGRFVNLVCLGKANKPILYRLDLIEDVLETKVFFVRPETFNFKQWSEQSFGVYHGDKIITAEILFSPKVSTSAGKIKFHASQHLVWQRDNSLKIYFKCKGWKELIHELMHPDWQGEVKIIQPLELKNALKEFLKASKSMI